ncbi:oxidoreductase [Penicillium angulare]|uniref:oxidoreductase n=1 Tax=Penicillium angulare TaxID=116970 RepID=UPI0025409398|nr:oxidoreductase [Penicillium angulare]KAJ5272336.1 oxidoreductase [Penicillium angulare]
MTDPLDIPLIDIATENDHAAGKAMLDAAVKFGFLYVDILLPGKDSHVGSTSSFPGQLTSDTQSKEFFHLPRDEKALYKRGSDNKGWVGMMVETLDPEHHEVSSDFFTSRHDPSKGLTGNSLRLLYYPEDVTGYCPGKDIRAGAHSDYGSVTLLFQLPGQPGLEILTPDERWAPVPIYPRGVERNFPFPPILVNIGDMLSYWTDGLLKSTVHRVVFPNADGENQLERSESRDRYSIAFFCQPVESTELGPIPSDLVTSYRQRKAENASIAIGYGGGSSALNTSQRTIITAKEHLQARLNATYV